MNCNFERCYEDNFDVPTTLSLIEIFKLFDLLMLACEIMVVFILFLYLDKTFFPDLLLNNVYPINICFYIEKNASI